MKTIVATWNMDAKASPESLTFLRGLAADIYLLAEVPPDFALDGFDIVFSRGSMARGQHCAAIATKTERRFAPLELELDFTVAVSDDSSTLVSSTLPWPRADVPYFVGSTQAEQTVAAVDTLASALRGLDGLVWGGDWNHPLSGSLQGFSRQGADSLAQLVSELDLTVHTRGLKAQQDCGTIDHIASHRPALATAEHIPAGALSDHDAYRVTLKA
jgi:hypothetical protein